MNRYTNTNSNIQKRNLKDQSKEPIDNNAYKDPIRKKLASPI